MNLPRAIERQVEEALSGVGAGGITRSSPVGGGCISPAARIDTDAGGRYFLKWEDGSAPPDFFRSQAAGLAAMAEADAVRVPHVISAADGWLLLEWLAPGEARENTWPELGAHLAALHKRTWHTFGLDTDNYIGSLPQSNGARSSWPAFWAEQRIGPQWEQACRAGCFGPTDQADFDRLLAVLGDVLAPGNDDGPSLVHGDLWGGNVHIMDDGRAALIDPAVFYGHREVDLAMAEMFGGFDRSFHVTYREEWPLHPGYDEERRDLYQLYFQLVHVNLFGHGYVGGVRRVLRRYRG